MTSMNLTDCTPEYLKCHYAYTICYLFEQGADYFLPLMVMYYPTQTTIIKTFCGS
jgi:hypothetical protein